MLFVVIADLQYTETVTGSQKVVLAVNGLAILVQMIQLHKFPPRTSACSVMFSTLSRSLWNLQEFLTRKRATASVRKSD